MRSTKHVALASGLTLWLIHSGTSAAQDSPRAATSLHWVGHEEINQTQWGFDDLNIVGWAQAARSAAQLCGSLGGGAGHFNGHQDLTKGVFGLQCSGPKIAWRDASAQEVSSSGWGFTDVNEVSWAQANRAAERLCAAANQGFSGGHFNGQQLDGKYGLFCYGEGSQWFDATDAELAATGWGFATPKLDDVPWAQAMRAATGYCQSKGFDGGFMNGHQAPNRYGIVCQKWAPNQPVVNTTASAPAPGPLTIQEAPSPIVPPMSAVRARFGAILRITSDSCPFTDFATEKPAQIEASISNSQLTLPLYVFGSIFDRPVSLMRSGTGLSYEGPVGVTASLFPPESPAKFYGSINADLMAFDLRFEINGPCGIIGTIGGSRIEP